MPSPTDIPVLVDFQEIQDLLTFLDAHPDVVRQLHDVGLAATVIPAAHLALPAAGIADLIQDLDDLAELVEQHTTALAPNKKFDAPSQVPALRAAANDIRLGLAQYRTADAQRVTVDLRNRAWTWLHLSTPVPDGPPPVADGSLSRQARQCVPRTRG